MITRERLYILRYIKTNQVCAISESEELITNYIKLFQDYFGEDYDIQKIVNMTRINKYLIEYQDYQVFQRGNRNKLTLTEWEWFYYKDIFILLYERMKETIINLKMFHDIYEYDNNTKKIGEQCELLSDALYDISDNMYEFIGNLPINYIKKHILNEPIVAHQGNANLLEIHLEYLEKILK